MHMPQPQDASTFNPTNSSTTGYSTSNSGITNSSSMAQSFTQALTGLPVVSAGAPLAPYYSASAANAPMPMTMMMMGTNMLNADTIHSGSSSIAYSSGGVAAAHQMMSVGPIPMTATHEAPAPTQQHTHYQQQQQRHATPIQTQTELQPSQQQQPNVPELDKQWVALKALKWVRGKELTAYVQDLALQSGKRALVATSGGSYKKFVCSSETPCPWLINAVCSRPRKRPRRRDDDNGGGATAGIKGEGAGGGGSGEENSGRYWYITSGNLNHTNCSSSAKPTARQLKNSYLMQAAVQDDSRVSSAVLVERLKQQEQLVCSKSMVYKAKTDLLDELAKNQHQASSESNNNPNNGLDGPGSTAQLLESMQCLPSYLTQMSALNPHAMSFVERDDDGTFLRAVLAMDPTGVWNDQSVLGVDSCEIQHRSYNGTELVLVGRDGNLDPIVHALALVPEESPEHCTWFLEKLIAHGFPLRRFPLFTNGHWGFSASCATQQIPHVMYCTQHLIDDMRQNQAITLRGGDQEALVWKAQQAETESEYFATLGQLGQLNFAAAHYIKSLDPKRWALFPYLAMRKMYGWQTTFMTAVDHGQSMGLAPRSQLPFEFFKAMSLILMTGTFQRHERAVQWEREQRVVTPEAERLMQEEMKLLPMYNVAMSTPHLAFVWNANEPQIRQRRVDLQHRTCTCAFRMQWGVPCRHILAALQKLANGFNQTFEYFDECYLVRNYVSSFKGRYLELPLDEAIQRDTTLLPARLVNKANSTSSTSNSTSQEDGNQDSEQQRMTLKKRRVRNRPLEDRKRGIYKCHKCNRADGHNKGTCPYQLHQQQPSIPVVTQQQPPGP